MCVCIYIAYIPKITGPDNAQSAETTRGSLQSSGAATPSKFLLIEVYILGSVINIAVLKLKNMEQAYLNGYSSMRI